jgi:hypothetical protein
MQRVLTCGDANSAGDYGVYPLRRARTSRVSLERENLAALKIDAGHDVLDGAVLSGRVSSDQRF